MMKCYLLLRDNKESGPYSLEELKALDLRSNDLVWIEGSSTSWLYPAEIASLASFVKPESQKEVASAKSKDAVKTKRIFVSLPYAVEQQDNQRIEATEIHDEEPVLETRYCQSFDEMKALYAKRMEERKTSFKKRRFDARGAFWIAGLFIGIICCAFVVKKMVDGFDEHLFQEDTPTAVAAKSTMTNPDAILDENSNASSPNYQNVLATEVIPGDNIATQNEAKEAPQAVAKNTLRKTTKSKNISRAINIKNNHYHVGLFGGVQDLKLTITNNSAYILDGVTVKVAFLKPNGQSIKEEEIEATDIPAKGAKTIAVPSSNRGIKVKYEIIKVRSKNYDNLLET